VLLLIDLLFRRRRVRGALAALLVGAGMGATIAAQWRELVHAERDVWEWSVGIALSLAALLSALLLARLVIDWLSEDRRPADAWPAARLTLAALLKRDDGALLGLVRFFWLFSAAVMNLLLCFDARYRDFPIFLYALPVLGLALLALSRRRGAVRPGLEEKLLASWVALSSVVVAVLEGPANGPALVWVLIGLLLSGPTLVEWRQGRARSAGLEAREQQGA
jgi:glucan 1,3-beta-glucosidase